MRGKAFYLGLIILVGLIGYAGVGGLSIEIQSSQSASPMNMGLYGTSELMRLVSRSGYKAAILGSVQEISSLRASRLVYVLIAPDKPLTAPEIQVIGRLWREGRISLLVADEWGIANPLTEQLLGVAVNGSQLREKSMVEAGLEDFIAGTCRVEGSENPVVFSKPSAITMMPAEASPVCMAKGELWLDMDANGFMDEGEPAMSTAVLGVALERGKARALVLADSSIFVNYMLQGAGNLPPTQAAVKGMVDWLAAGDRSTVFLFDNSHYRTSRYDPTMLLRTLLLFPQIVVQSVMSIASAAGQYKYMLFASMLVIPLAGMVMRPELGGGEARQEEWRWNLARRLVTEAKAGSTPCVSQAPPGLMNKALRSLRAAEELASLISRCLEREREP